MGIDSKTHGNGSYWLPRGILERGYPQKNQDQELAKAISRKTRSVRARGRPGQAVEAGNSCERSGGGPLLGAPLARAVGTLIAPLFSRRIRSAVGSVFSRLTIII